MRVKQISKALALLMIYLIISITFFSASVFATIFKAEGMGQDQAPGVIRSTDNLVIKTESVMPCSVSGEFTNNTFIQMNCGSGTPMSCAYTKQVTNVTGTMSAVVMESASEETKDIIVYVDNSPPTIISLTTSSLGNKVKATYNIRDTANVDYLDKCGGIKKVELLLNNQVVNTTNHTVGLCTVNSFLTGTIANYIGKVNTSIRVQDYVGLGTNATGSEVFIDSTSPKIKTGAKTYYPGTTDEIKIISTNSTKERTADIMVIIDENALAQSGSVFGDFHLLDKTNTSTQGNVAATCTRAGWNETYECTFSGIKLMPSSASTPINIIATDQAGNTANQSMSLTFSVANSAGTVTRVGPETSRCIGSTCYVKAGTNNITADISSSSSFNQSEVLIQGTKAECTRISNWQCHADAVIRTGATFIEVTGTDDLGNVLSGRGNITVDSSAPAKIGVLNSTPDCPTSKESLRIVVNVSEAQSPSLKIRAITDSISTNNETIATCSKIGTTSNWQCILTVSNLKSEGINTNLAVIVEDFAGNQLVESVPVKICVEVNEIPELIEKIKTTGTLPRIDRKTVSKIVVKVPLSLQIVLKEPSVEITQRSTVTCAGTPGLSGQAYMIDETGLTPTLVVPLKCEAKESCNEQWDEAGKILINCTQEFNIKQGNRIYTQRESESITAELEYYNQPLGGINETFNKKITEIKTDIQKLDKQIAKRDKIHKFLGTICKLAEGIGKINQLLQSLRAVALGVCLGFTATGFLAGVGNAIWKPINKISSSVMKIVEQYIWPSGWTPVGPKGAAGLVIKGTCSVYTCKFYDFNTWVDIVISLTGYYHQKADIAKLEAEARAEVLRLMDAADETLAKTDEEGGFDITTVLPESDLDTEYVTEITIDGKEYAVEYEINEKGMPVPSQNFIAEDGTRYTTDDEGYITIDGKKYAPEYLTDADGQPITPTGTYEEYVETPPVPETEVRGEKPGDSPPPPPKVTPPLNPVQKALSEGKRVIQIYAKRGIFGSDRIGPETILLGWQIGDFQYDVNFQRAPETGLRVTNPRQSGFYVVRKTQIYSYDSPPAGKVIASDSITGNAGLLGGLDTMKNIKPLTDDEIRLVSSNVRIQNAVDAFLGEKGTWIYNPYKSKHYDGMCYPAILFNDKKEKQLLCKRLVCLEKMSEIGGPIEACEFDYNLDMCMYVESAKYKLEGPAHLDNIFNNVMRAFFSNVLGNAAVFTYLYVFPGCMHIRTLPIETPSASDATCVAPDAWQDTACGVIGSLLSAREIVSFLKNPYNPIGASDVPSDPVKQSGGNDFCKGVDYTT